MIKPLLLGLAMAFISLTGKSSDTTVTIVLNNGLMDATIDNYYPNQPSYNDIQYYSGAWTIGGQATYWRNFFKFDLSQIPANAVISHVGLSLHWANVNNRNNMEHSKASNSNESVLERITADWDATTLNWNNQPGVSGQNAVTLPESTNGTEDYLDMDVTDMVQEMVVSGNYGFRLKLTNEDYYAALLFASADNPNESRRPTLTITYSVPKNCHLYVLSPKNMDAMITDYHDVPEPDGIQYFSGSWTIDGGHVSYRNLLAFDLNDIPADAEIEAADLSLFWADTSEWGHKEHTSLSASNESVLHRVVDPWSEDSVTWYNQPEVDESKEVVLAESTSGQQNYLNMDVTDMVADMMEFGNYGFRLKQVNEQHYAALLFASGDAPNVARRPQLNVCYSVPSAIVELKKDKLFSMSPNPAKDEFEVSLNKVSAANLSITDVQGRLLKTIQINQAKQRVSLDLPAGTYLVQLKTDKELHTERLVVQ